MTPTEEKHYLSTLSIDNFSSTTKLTPQDVSIPVKGPPKEQYNPFEHRQVEHPNSSFGSLVHLLKSSLGTGILAMPLAFKNGGLLFGIIGTILTGILCTHCVQMLVRASHELCRRTKVPSLGFSETAEAVFLNGPKSFRWLSSTARIVVDTALISTYFFGGGVYVVFVCESIKQLVDYYYPDLGWSIFMYMLIVFIPLVLSCQIRELKYLVPFSFLANVFMVTSFAITLYYMFTDVPSVKERKLFSSFEQLPLFFSTVVFAMEGIGVVLPVENTMRKPEQFLGCPGVLNVAMGIVITIYSVIGFFGYLRYGEDTAGSVTFNLPVDEILAQVVKVLIALSVFFTYSLQFYVAWDITWRKMLEVRIPHHWQNVSQIIIRTVIVALIVGVAALVPNLEPIITLVGSVCFSTLGIFIPAIVESLLVCTDEINWRSRLTLVKDAFLAIFSLFILSSGSYYSIMSIVQS